jgi:hypothetical protein
VRLLADGLRLLGQGLSFAFGRAPRSRVALAGFGAFVLAWAAVTALFCAIDASLTTPPRVFDAQALWIHAGFGLGLLAAAWVGAHVLRRPALWLTLATLAVIASAPWMAFDLQLETWLANQPRIVLTAWHLLVWIVVLVLLVRMHWVLGRGVPMVLRLVAPLLFGLVLAAPWHAREKAWFWYLDEDATADEDTDAPDDAPPPRRQPPDLVREDPEVVLGRQPALVAAQVQALRAQTPGSADLYAVGFAGDGTEPPFRNEVEFLDTLLARRFAAQGRMVALVNSPATVAATPLATLANLRAALAGVGARMDREDDIALLFLTSHGSPDHQLAVSLPPLPLRQLRPEDVRAALDDAGIRWRVVVVSACFSGGFIDALRDPQTLVITAARADRTSFGCGAHSQITWFGEAFLTEALNRTTDFQDAFAIASKAIRERELAQDSTPSVPQLWAGARIGAKLAAWRAALPGEAPAVPFAPGGVATPTPHAQDAKATPPH